MLNERAEYECEECHIIRNGTLLDTRVVDGDETQVERGQDRLEPQIKFGNRDAYGSGVDPRVAKKLHDTAAMHNLTDRERASRLVVGAVSEICAVERLPQTVTERAAYIARRVVEDKFFRAETPILAKTAVLIACDEQRVFFDPKSPGREKANLLRYRRLIAKRLRIRPKHVNKAEWRVIDFAKDARLGAEVETEALRILRASTLMDKTTGKPTGIAAGAISLAVKRLGLPVTRKDIEAATRVGDDTIRKYELLLAGHSEP